MNSLGDYPPGAANDPDAPYNQTQHYCKKCGEEIYYDHFSEMWLHSNTEREECDMD